MKKRMVAGLLAAACLMGMCSCGSTDSSADSGKRDKQAKTASLDENAEVAYINVWMRLFGLSHSSVYEGREEACQEQLKDWNGEPSGEIPAAYFQTLYLNNGKFDYYYYVGDIVNGMKLAVSGTVSKDKEDALAFSPQVIRSYNNDDYTLEKIIHYPEETEQEYSRRGSMMYNQLKTGSETQGLYLRNAYNCGQDKHRYLQNAYVWNAEEQDWVSFAGVGKNVFLPILSKGDYLVTEQQGYTLSTEQAGESFSLYFSDAAFREDQPISYTITFDSDHTWSSDWQDGYHGKWELLDENLLLLYPPEDGYTPNAVSIFYVDFAEDAVYMPLFVKSETMLPEVQQIVLEDEVK